MRSALAVCVVAAFAATSCGGKGQAPLRLSVSPRDAPADTPLTIAVSGAKPSSRVEVTAATEDARGRTWRAHAFFVADRNGRIDVRSDPAVAGTYRGVAAMGLLWSMREVASRYPPSEVTLFPPSTQRVRFAAGPAHVTAVRRWVPKGVVARDETQARDGFVGCYFAPRHPRAKLPAVMILGGSEGGLHCSDATIAAHGLAVLDVAYFGYPSLPVNLVRIPVEYFCGALRWLGRQPAVDAGRLAVWGISRGAEAALLTGLHCPDAHRVVASVGFGAVGGGCCSGQSNGRPAWTVGGRAVAPGTVLPIWRIRGDMMLIGGEMDALTDSGIVADQEGRELRSHGRRGDVVLTYAHAGHALGYATPYVPVSDTYFDFGVAAPMGGTLAGDARARADAWPRAIAFLQG